MEKKFEVFKISADNFPMKYFINITCFNSLLSKYYNRCHGILKQDIIVILKQNNVIVEKDTRYYYFISLEDAENAVDQLNILVEMIH